MVIEYLNRKSRATLALLGLIGAVFIGQLDYITGPMGALMAFYLFRGLVCRALARDPHRRRLQRHLVRGEVYGPRFH